MAGSPHDTKGRAEVVAHNMLGIEDYPPMDELRLGLPGREQELDWVLKLVVQGKTDKVAAMQAWVEIGFDGPIRPDHVPTLEGESNDDPAYAWLGRLHAVGFLQGLRAAAMHGTRGGND
jgi:D-mannonate dehydratase